MDVKGEAAYLLVHQFLLPRHQCPPLDCEGVAKQGLQDPKPVYHQAVCVLVPLPARRPCKSTKACHHHPLALIQPSV
eukprot:scaffold305272_cov36-Prasinocladus_malaysianus.AAC.1